ncbi:MULTISPECIES: TolC family protein [Cellulophaga]|uniref:Outer membrane efflux protein n=1 Tax=Cellulophaga geojensis KL-A TaxID=1328323 RepID=A0ABN0RS85_9FLAO|nr:MULTISPECIES: TolC family protein [Cellulophaga]EWH14740.1 outer membrane efflux protein [Cellulophaga geojensis KL-A]SNQ44573.1 Outer membrane efflux protein [Cellulophaga lytica]
MNKYIILFFSILCFTSQAQETDSILSLEEYLGYVKKYHPIVKQARLITTESEAKLLKSRGAFDPKLEVDFSNKEFKGTTYYDKLNAAFKIPTWYGVELKANYENNEGTYLNPEYNTPEDGLYSAGVSVSLAKGLLTNKRMATLKQAKLYTQQAAAKQKLVVNDFLFDATEAYFNWLKNYKAKLVYSAYLKNAEVRLLNVKKSFFAGDKPAVDTLEASINYKNRLLDIEKARIGYIKSKLEVSNFLWLQNNLPLEITDAITPDTTTINSINTVLNSSLLNTTEELVENHPKLKELQIKKNILTIDKRYKTNNLLPKIDLQYNFLSSDYQNLDSFNTSNYKTGLAVSFPLFLRKERADLKLTKVKLKDIDFDIMATKVNLSNKIESGLQQIESYNNQHTIIKDLVKDYKKLVYTEERKFNLGEGSLFLVNYREVKLIETQLKEIDTEYNLFLSKSKLLSVINML